MFGITDIWTYIIGAIFIIILPGPNSIYVMSVASRFGVKTGYQAAFGVFVGDLILILATVLGAASLLKAFPWIFILLKVVGAGYLSYLGIRLCIAAYKTWNNATKNIQSQSKQQELQSFHPFRSALTISLINPKAILFYLSFFIQFVDPAYAHPAISFTLLATILQFLSMTYLTLLIFSGIKLAHYFNRYYKLAAAGITVVGISFCIFGFKLATSSLS